MRDDIKILLGCFISATCLILAARNVIWHDVITSALTANPFYLLIGTVFILLSDILYAVRWSYILLPVRRISLQRSFAYTMIGFCLNGILPLRTGDLVRSGLTSKFHSIPLSMTISVTALIHLIDIFLLIVLALLFSFFLAIPSIIKDSLNLLLGGTFFLFFLLLFFRKQSRIISSIFVYALSFLPILLCDKIRELFIFLRKSIHLIYNSNKILPIILISVCQVIVQGLATLIWLEAFHLGVPWYAGFFILTVYNIGCALPSSPGAIGLYHYLVILALSLWVTDTSYSMSYALVSHAILILINIIIGGIFALHIGIKKIRNNDISINKDN